MQTYRSVLSLLLLFSCLFAFVSCFDDPIFPEHEHIYLEEVHPSTCQEYGYTVYRCYCGDSYRVDMNTLSGHHFNGYFTVDIAATKYRDGLKSRHCKYCDAKIEETVIPCLGEEDFPPAPLK